MKKIVILFALFSLGLTACCQSKFPKGVIVGTDTLVTWAQVREYVSTHSGTGSLTAEDTLHLSNRIDQKVDAADSLHVTTEVLFHVGDTTVTEHLGLIVYKTSNNHFYGCVYVGSAHPSWKQLDN